MTYKIFVNTDNGKLTFKNVTEYKEIGSFIEFTDVITKRILRYPILRTQIEVETDE